MGLLAIQAVLPRHASPGPGTPSSVSSTQSMPLAAAPAPIQSLQPPQHGPPPANFATLITGAARPEPGSRQIRQSDRSRTALLQSIARDLGGPASSRRASSSGSASSGVGSRSSSRLSLADPTLTREWRLRPAGEA